MSSERRVFLFPGDSPPEGSFVVHYGGRQLMIVPGKGLFEVSHMQRRLGSWFIGESVEMGGALYVVTAIDPIFVFLPLLDAKARESFRAFDEVVSEGGQELRAICAKLPKIEEQVSVVCEAKQVPGMGTFVRLSRTKVLRWLLVKVERLQQQASAWSRGTGGQSRAVIASNESSSSSFLPGAVDLLGDYLEPFWKNALFKHYKISAPSSSSAFGSMQSIALSAASSQGPSPPPPKSSGPVARKTASSTKKAKLDPKGSGRMENFFPKKSK